MRQPVKYRTREQYRVEQEELAIAAEFNEINDVQTLTRLYHEHKLKEFYQLANKVLRIKRSHPVVTRVMKTDEHGDVEAINDKSAAECAIAEYFTKVYKRPEHMPAQSRIDPEDDIVMGVDSDDEIMLEEVCTDEL